MRVSIWALDCFVSIMSMFECSQSTIFVSFCRCSEQPDCGDNAVKSGD